jgi:exodeoxyribonuclease VII large subunit
MAVKPVTVSQLNGYINRVLRSDPVLGLVSVIGEIANLTRHASGHIYFSLKDKTGRIGCFLAAGAQGVPSSSRRGLAEGMEVVASGYISVYEKGGYYSLNITEIEGGGRGDLALAFDRLKERLSEEGLFDERHKRALPFFPRKLAVVTSETGAAIRDIVKIVESRNNCVDILLYPVRVQGDGAAEEIAEAIGALNRLFPETDCMIVGRGGGAAEELQAFNEEVVARAVFASEIPVISAVGHETDFTIMDFVADRRAETPTAAAQTAVPDTRELLALIGDFRAELSDRARGRTELLALRAAGLKSELSRLAERELAGKESRVAALGAALASLDPVAVLERGYAVLTAADGAIITSAADASSGDAVRARLADGELALEVL